MHQPFTFTQKNTAFQALDNLFGIVFLLLLYYHCNYAYLEFSLKLFLFVLKYLAWEYFLNVQPKLVLSFSYFFT